MARPSALVIMTAALVLNVVGFANYAAVLHDLLADTGFPETAAGIAGGAFFLAYAIGSPVFAALTDSHPPRRLYVLGCLLGVAGGVLFPLVDDGYAALLASRALSGFGMAGVYMPGLRLLIEALPAERQSRGASVYISALTLGLSASFAVSGLLQLASGWPAAFLGAAAAAGTALLLVTATIPARRVAPADSGLLGRLRAVLQGRGVPLVLAAAAGNSWEGMAFRTWWVALLAFVVAQPGNEAYLGWNLALATAFTGMLAMPLSTWVAQRAETGRRHRVIAAAAASSVAVGLVLSGVLGTGFLAVFGLSVLYACVIFSDAGSLPPALLARVRPEERGAALALLAAASNTAACLAVAACGAVLDLAGGAGSPLAWRVTIAVMATGSLAVAVAMVALDKLDTRTQRRPP